MGHPSLQSHLWNKHPNLYTYNWCSGHKSFPFDKCGIRILNKRQEAHTRSSSQDPGLLATVFHCTQRPRNFPGNPCIFKVLEPMIEIVGKTTSAMEIHPNYLTTALNFAWYVWPLQSKKKITVSKISNEPRKKHLLTFHYTGCLMGILMMVYYNLHITG